MFMVSEKENMPMKNQAEVESGNENMTSVREGELLMCWWSIL